MKIKFWQRNTDGGQSPRMSKPRELPDGVGRYLVVELKRNPDWVWQLMVVYRDRPDGGGVRDLLIFDPKQANRQGVQVTDYARLSQHPELILFAGWDDKARKAFEINPTPAAADMRASA